jgi:hypothetical protein
MPFADAPQLNAREDDALACVDVMSPRLQLIIDRRYPGDALVRALTTAYAELILDRGGRKGPLLKALDGLARLPPDTRRQARLCLGEIRRMNETIRAQGFSKDAITWSLMGAITNIHRQLGAPKAQIDECRNGMIMHLNDARKKSIN